MVRNISCGVLEVVNPTNIRTMIGYIREFRKFWAFIKNVTYAIQHFILGIEYYTLTVNVSFFDLLVNLLLLYLIFLCHLDFFRIFEHNLASLFFNLSDYLVNQLLGLLHINHDRYEMFLKCIKMLVLNP